MIYKDGDLKNKSPEGGLWEDPELISSHTDTESTTTHIATPPEEDIRAEWTVSAQWRIERSQREQ